MGEEYIMPGTHDYIKRWIMERYIGGRDIPYSGEGDIPSMEAAINASVGIDSPSNRRMPEDEWDIYISDAIDIWFDWLSEAGITIIDVQKNSLLSHLEKWATEIMKSRYGSGAGSSERYETAVREIMGMPEVDESSSYQYYSYDVMSKAKRGNKEEE